MALPDGSQLFIGDGGLETTMIFEEGFELPEFASFGGGEPWLSRIGGIRANASRRSHAELDEATELDSGDPVELGSEYAAIAPELPDLRVVGGCCGTDRRHVAAICDRLAG